MNFQLFGKKHVPDDMNPIDPTNMCSTFSISYLLSVRS